MDEKSDTQISRTFAVAEAVPAKKAARCPARPMYLIVVSGGIPGAMIRLSNGGTRVGRSSEANLRIPDISISRHHATISIDAKGKAWVTDQGSTNGTFVNRVRVPPLTPTRLTDGDRLRFGPSFVVKFVSLDPCDEQFQRELFERTVRDPLTGLFNRAYFLDQLGPTFHAGTSRGLGMAVILLDVDFFKKVNDTYGHDAGDAVLCEVAQVLRECTRNEDLVSRYGGEEFILALPVAAPDQATTRAERIRAAIASRRVTVEGVTLRVTASLGLAYAWPGRVRPAETLIKAADRGLYQAKNAGRNRVVFGEESSSADDYESNVVTPRETDF